MDREKEKDEIREVIDFYDSRGYCWYNVVDFLTSLRNGHAFVPHTFNRYAKVGRPRKKS